MSATISPYQAPLSDVGHVSPTTGIDGDPEEIRREYLSHEASIQAIGSLYLISAIMLFLGGIFGGAMAIMAEESSEVGTGVGMGVVLTAFGAMFYWLSRSMRKLDPRMKVPVGVLATLGLFNPPIGTLINLYILWAVFGAKGKFVLSEEYAAVREATPDIQYKTSPVVKAFAIGLLVLVVGSIGFALM